MVFVLDSREKIEADRKIDDKLTERYSYTQVTDDIFHDPKVSLKMGDMLETHVDVSRFYAWEELTGGILGAFHDAFLNAAMHGNKNKPGSVVRVEVEYGLLGSSVFVKDEGPGFDYRAVIEACRNGRPYATRNGGGTRKFQDSYFHISYHDNGSLISISTPLITLDHVREFNSRHSKQA